MTDYLTPVFHLCPPYYRAWMLLQTTHLPENEHQINLMLERRTNEVGLRVIASIEPTEWDTGQAIRGAINRRLAQFNIDPLTEEFAPELSPQLASKKSFIETVRSVLVDLATYAVSAMQAEIRVGRGSIQRTIKRVRYNEELSFPQPAIPPIDRETPVSSEEWSTVYHLLPILAKTSRKSKHHYGLLQINGRGFPQKPRAATLLLEEAAFGASFAVLSKFYCRNRDFDKALDYAEKGSRLGELKATLILGTILSDGPLSLQNHTRAIAIFKTLIADPAISPDMKVKSKIALANFLLIHSSPTEARQLLEEAIEECKDILEKTQD